jgi:hypothetical protein
VLRSLRRAATIRHLRRLIDYQEKIIRDMERRALLRTRELQNLRLQLEQERGWRYDMPAGKAAARMEMLRESGRVEPVAP